MRVDEVSIGDYVLNGGEVAVLVIVEAVARLLPGVLGNAESLVEESHGGDGLLEYPVYTKPPTWRGLAVPEVLLSRRPRPDRPVAARRGASPYGGPSTGPGRRAASEASASATARSCRISAPSERCGRLDPRSCASRLRVQPSRRT